MAPLMTLPESLIPFLEPYLPPSPLVEASPTIPSSPATMPSSLTTSIGSISALPQRIERPTVVKPVYPFITLTYAQSLDSKISKKPGTQTAISHLETKTMTHYLRSKHDGILVGIGTVLADDPGLDCRFEESLFPGLTTPSTPAEPTKLDGFSGGNSGNTAGSTPVEEKETYNFPKHPIKPIIVDPEFKFYKSFSSSRIYKTYESKKGLSPVIVINEKILEGVKGVDRPDYETFCNKYDITLVALKQESNGKLPWSCVMKSLKHVGLNSVMVEGGSKIINDLLNYIDESGSFLVDSLVITVGPVYLGADGVNVSPSKSVRLKDSCWWTGKQDSVLGARLSKID